MTVILKYFMSHDAFIVLIDLNHPQEYMYLS